MKSILIYGAGGFAREVLHLCEQTGIDVLGFIVDPQYMKSELVNGLPLVGSIEDIKFDPHEIEIVCAGVGDPKLKQIYYEKIKTYGYKIARPIIHPNVFISKHNTIGEGTVICEGSILTTNISIGVGVVINLACTIGHDSIVEDFVTLSPDVNVSGNVTIGQGAYIGTNASIREKVTIGEWSVIGGGAFVAGNIPSKVLFAGVPAIHKKNLD